jgi:hypothetical protein
MMLFSHKIQSYLSSFLVVHDTKIVLKREDEVIAVKIVLNKFPQHKVIHSKFKDIHTFEYAIV